MGPGVKPLVQSRGSSQLSNQQSSWFAKSAWHHAGLESSLQLENQAATTMLPPQHPAEEPDKYSGAGLATKRVQHCWLQPCPRQDHLRLGCAEAWEGNQSWEREEENASKRSCPRFVKFIGLQMIKTWFQDLFNSLVLQMTQQYLRFPSCSWNLDWTIRLLIMQVDCIELLLSAFYAKSWILLWIQKRELKKIQFNHGFITEIQVMIILDSSKWIHITYSTTEFNTINSEYWIILDFQ